MNDTITLPIGNVHDIELILSWIAERPTLVRNINYAMDNEGMLENTLDVVRAAINGTLTR